MRLHASTGFRLQVEHRFWKSLWIMYFLMNSCLSGSCYLGTKKKRDFFCFCHVRIWIGSLDLPDDDLIYLQKQSNFIIMIKFRFGGGYFFLLVLCEIDPGYGSFFMKDLSQLRNRPWSTKKYVQDKTADNLSCENLPPVKGVVTVGAGG